MFACECCWYCRQNCTHYGLLGDCTSGVKTMHDQQLYNSVKSSMLHQNGCTRCFLHIPACWPCFIFSAAYGCCCEGSTHALYQASKLNQSHRFSECVCFNIVLGFTMVHDPQYIFEDNSKTMYANPVIHISNNNVNSVKTGDVNVKTGDVSNSSNATNTSSNSTNGLTDMQRKIKEARVEKLLQEGRYSDAEAIAVELK